MPGFFAWERAGTAFPISRILLKNTLSGQIRKMNTCAYSVPYRNSSKMKVKELKVTKEGDKDKKWKTDLAE